MASKIRNLIAQTRTETAILLRCIPATAVSLFVVSVISMNLLANKTIVQTGWIALDGGILISWLSFMCMDVITKYFGPKASNTIAVLAACINLLTCLIFYVASIIPSNAGDYTELCELGRAYEEGIPGTVRADKALAARIYARGAQAGDRRCREALARLQAARTEAA